MCALINQYELNKYGCEHCLTTTMTDDESSYNGHAQSITFKKDLDAENNEISRTPPPGSPNLTKRATERSGSVAKANVLQALDNSFKTKVAVRY